MAKKQGARKSSQPGTQELYTYRGKDRVSLSRRDDQFVVRASPETLRDQGFEKLQAVSPHSTRVTVSAANRDSAMEQCRGYAVTHHAYEVADSNQEFLITDRVVITFKNAPTDTELDGLANKYALVKLKYYGDRDYLFQLTDHTGMNPVKLVVKLMETEPGIENVDHDLNQRMSRMEVAIPQDPEYLEQWHLHTRLTDRLFDPRSSSRCENAWQTLGHFGSAEVVVGVTDDGCRIDHRDFNSPAKFAGFGFFDGNRLITNLSPGGDPSRMYVQGEDHGTSCAGVIGAEVDGSLTVGAAPGCRLLPIRWEVIQQDGGEFLATSDSKLLDALNFVSDKVDVLSNSWGSSPVSRSADFVVRRIRELALTGGRRGKGIVFLWAAGNENCPIEHTATIDVPFTEGIENRRFVRPATARVFRHNLVGIPGVMHVAAVASNAQRSHYSNYGFGIDISAPSNNLHTYRRISSITGLNITTVEGTTSDSTTFFGGTSSATPLAAGIAALVISANPNLTALEVISILKRTASKDLNFTPYPKTPRSNAEPDTSWDVSPIAPFNTGEFRDIGSADGTWSPWFGHGRVDAQAAVVEALRLAGAAQPQQQVLRRASAPALAIPDNDPTGVRNPIAFSDPGRVSSLRVNVDITHSFIGDLVVNLISPSGKSVALSNRNGGAAQDMRRDFTLADTPALSNLNGEPISGNWTLSISDDAGGDVGVLNRWELDFAMAPAASAELDDAPGLAIPDNNSAGIERSLTVTATGVVRDISVALDITHNFVGDLSVTLTSPAGTIATLHTVNGNDDSDNIIGTFTTANLPALAAFRGQQMAGTWTLKVADVAQADEGKLNRWSLRIDRGA